MTNTPKHGCVRVSDSAIAPLSCNLVACNLVAIRLIVLLLALTSASTASAAYRVELLLFEQLTGAREVAEEWDATATSESGGVDLFAGERVSGLQMVGSERYGLTAVANRIDASPNYRMLLHRAWIQPRLGRNQAPHIRIEGAQESAGVSVSGTVRLITTRYHHLYLDLVLSDGSGRYPHKAHRKLISDELHYIDHPVFGALVLIRRT